jgi:hypothetical protein
MTVNRKKTDLQTNKSYKNLIQTDVESDSWLYVGLRKLIEHEK